MKKRILTGRNVRYSAEDRKAIIEQLQLIRDAYEDDHLGGYEKIYPCDEDYETEYFARFINYAQDLFEEQTGGPRISLGTKRPTFVKRSAPQTTPQRVSKKEDITQIYSKASTFLQKQLLKS